MESLKGLRILVVEDDQDCAELFKFILEDAGARVITVEKAGEALARQDRYKPDVLVSNLIPPDLDGYALVKLMKAYEAQRGRKLVAVALTPCEREVNRVQILSSGFHTYIPKPINLDLLLAELENLIELEKVSQHKSRQRIQSTTGRRSYKSRISDSAQLARASFPH